MLAASFLAGIPTKSAATQILFSENFSGNLNAWSGKAGEAQHGEIVNDPLIPANQVLNFTALNYSGDIFSPLIQVPQGSRILLSFDYLGLAQPGSVAGNLGGFVGISDSLTPQSGGAAWVAGTDLSAVNGLGQTGIQIVDDGQWHHYTIDLTSLLSDNGISSFYVMLEDWGGAGGVAGDAYFDDINVRATPDGLNTAVSLGMVAGLMLFSYGGARPSLRKRSHTVEPAADYL